MRVLIQHLMSDNDINGNARRLFLIMDNEGDIIEAIDEGSLGSSVYAHYIDRALLPGMHISVKEYRRYLKTYPQLREA